MGLISVAEARAQILHGIVRLGPEDVALAAANGRTLAVDLAAHRTQPPFNASAMDGYALRADDIAQAPADLTVIGTAPAGRAFAGIVASGQAVRIFTGAPVPEGADSVLIQENTLDLGSGRMRALQPVERGRNIRPAGLDFRIGQPLLPAGRRLAWRDLSLAAAMDYPVVPVIRRPKVAILATGDELVRPGEPTGPDQIVTSNSYGIAALVESLGGEPLDCGIVGDRRAETTARIHEMLALDPDVIVTLGGASVGDHDSVRDALADAGLDLAFWKIAMRPGKPLMFGRLGGVSVLGLPGNPVSSLVGAVLFLRPLVGALLGRDISREPAEEPAILGADVKANDSRADFLRATLAVSDGPMPVATPFGLQDSAMLQRFVAADCLILREPQAPAADAGAPCRIIRL